MCVDRDTFASSTGCLAKGTCAPDPTCAPTLDVDGTTPTSALEGYAWVAKDWSGAAKCGGDPDPYDDERIIKIAQNTIFRKRRRGRPVLRRRVASPQRPHD